MATNPVFNETAFERAQTRLTAANQMTLQGTINKSFFLLFLCVLGAMFSWSNAQAWLGLTWPLAIGSFVVALLISFKPATAPFLSPVYAVGQGLFLGAVSAMYNAQLPGVVMQAVAVTMSVFFIMLVLYKTRIIKVTRGLMIGIMSATGGVALFYIVSLILSLFGVNVSYFTSSAPWAIAVNIVICAVAAFNFLLDFNFIDKMTGEYSAPKYMEWYAGFGLLVTLIWLYLEVLRTLGRARSN